MTCQKALIYPEGVNQAAAFFQELRAGGYEVSYVRDGEVRENTDLLVICPDLGGFETLHDGEIGTGHDFDRMEAVLSEKLFAMKCCVDSAIPFMRGGGKRIAFLTSAASSVSMCSDCSQFAEHMLLAAVNMLAKMTFNRLRPMGFTVRCFAPSAGMTAGQYISRDFCYDANEPAIHSEENRLVMRNGAFVEIPW